MVRTTLATALLLVSCAETKDDATAHTADARGLATDDADGDGFSDSDDCNDADASMNPGATEVCDGVDNDCDGETDEGVSDTFYVDDDGDGYGDPTAAIAACEGGVGLVASGTDCDDTDSAIHPGAAEVCDDADNNCDGEVDEETGSTWYADGDGDGFGDPTETIEACETPDGYVSDNTDCDDDAEAAHPGREEVCDEIDNDCDGTVDEGVTTTFYEDRDGDGWGVAETTTEACVAPTGYAPEPGDCDDGDDRYHPEADESDCTDPEDYNCDGSVAYADADTDGWPACEDCDDDDGAVNPDALEVCNGIDDDCDGDIDDDDSSLDTSTADLWYVDADGDGYGDATSTVAACVEPSGATTDDTDCDDDEPDAFPGNTEVCDGVDNDCDGATDDLGPAELYAGSTTASASRYYQYSPVTAGAGYIKANWTADPAADSYEVAIGTTAGAEDVLAWTDVGTTTSSTLTGLSLDGAWDLAEYYVSIRATNAGVACDTSATSDAVQIAEAEVWTGDVADLRPDDALGGATEDWPEAGVDAVWGEHWFETVDIAPGTVVRVQGWGRVDGVTGGVSASAAAVTDPADGWVAFYANEVSIGGTITASGRGYGGGGGGGAGVSGGYQGYGGEDGLGGDGGPASTAYPGAGGGGSPGGAGGVGATIGGDGNLFGGGGGSTGCRGSDGRDGGDGSTGTIGGTGGTASSGSPGTAGVGEFTAGGASGVSGCDNWSGGGGGGYGGGGGGGGQWSSSTAETSGGGAGGTGGAGGGRTVHGAAAAGLFGGAGGTGNSGGSRIGAVGTPGGYLAAASNGDTSTDRSLALGSGGGGGGGGYQETGGGGGGAGGGAIHLHAYDTLWIESTASILANGAGGGGGARDNGGNSTSAAGGVGAGGGIHLEAGDLIIDAVYPYISARGGDGATSNGGTIKLFYDTVSGTIPSTSGAGRVYDAGPGSWVAP